jgi:hypothetical protein
MTIDERLQLITTLLTLQLQIRAPKDTGNLALNAIKPVYVEGGYQIIVGGEIAPYAPVTNEVWLSPRWNGKQNPHEGWIQSAIEEMRPTIVTIMTQPLTEEDVALLLNEQNKKLGEIQEQFSAKAEAKMKEMRGNE